MEPFDDTTPEATVRSWWRAWQQKDRALLERLAREDYLEFTGDSKGHQVGRNRLLALADETFEMYSITRWELSSIQQICLDGGTALVGYLWSLRARRGDGELRMRGVASDVLVRELDGWRYLSHHSTPLAREVGRDRP